MQISLCLLRWPRGYMTVPVKWAWGFHLKCSWNVKNTNCEFCTSVQTPESMCVKERAGLLTSLWVFLCLHSKPWHANLVLIHGQYKTAAKCPWSRQTGARLKDASYTVWPLFSSPGDSQAEIFMSKPTLKSAFIVKEKFFCMRTY